MRPLVRALVGGVLAFAATTVVTIAATAQFSDWSEAPDLAPLHPESVTAPETSTSENVTQITRTELTFPRSDGDAAAVLFQPQDGADVGVVLIAGAGGADRHTLSALAKRFAAAGVAALTYDKRTDGYSVTHRDYEQLADDALAAAGAMRTATELDRIGGWGISEGGWVLASAIARESSPLAFAVFASAPVVTPLEQTGWIIDRVLQGGPDLIRRVGATVVAQGRSLLNYLDFDARPLLRGTRVPVMSIWGADDATVPVNEAYRRMTTTLDGDLFAYIVPNAGHDLSSDSSAWLSAAASWMKSPTGDGLFGVNPTSDLGVPEPVTARWHADPRIHLAASSLIAGAVGFLIWQRSKAHPKRKRI